MPLSSDRYGARTTTVSFDTCWKFHLGDVSGAQGTMGDRLIRAAALLTDDCPGDVLRLASGLALVVGQAP